MDRCFFCFGMFYIYILYSLKGDRYYLGYSSDPWKRVEQHNENKKDKYTGIFGPWKLSAVFEVSEEKSEAVKIEKFIKRQKSRRLIELLINKDFVPEGSLAQLVRVPHVRG